MAPTVSASEVSTRRPSVPTGDPSMPESHRDLIDCPPVAALTTIMPDGYPQTSVVWCDTEGDLVRVNTMRGFQKERNMRRDPRVTLLCYDPTRPLRSLEVRGIVVEMTEDGARNHLDALASRYAGRPVHYFGDAIPARYAETETPVLCRIRPTHVVALEATRDGRRSPMGTPTPAAPRASSASSSSASSSSASAASASSASASAAASIPIPASHLDLLTRPICGVLTTMLPDGQPQSSLVWVDADGDCALVNTTLERRKGRNLLADPRVSLLVVDPGDTSRFIQIRGDAELVTDGALDHLDALTRKYTDYPCYYGFVFPREQAAHETRVICRIHPRRISLDAIHAGPEPASTA
jgi:PPOX class probable F420-dependent enzyme